MDMLNAYLNIRSKPVNEPPKRVKSKKPPKSTKRVEPFEGSTVHAQFKSGAPAKEPRGMIDTSVMNCDELDTLDMDMDEVPGLNAGDNYEYLWQEADTVPAEEEDTDSCLTFDEEVTDDDALTGSPMDAPIDVVDKQFFSKRKAKPSETPVYSGPELWFEDDDF